MNIVKKAGCILVNLREKKVALVLRRGDYSFPKGHLEEMETIKECAKRETIEETGHDVEIIGDEIYVTKYKSSAGEDVENHFFIGIDLGITKKKIAEKDKEITEWFTLDEIENKLTYNNLKEVWNKVKNKIEEIIEKIQLDILVSKQDKYYYSYIKLKDESRIPTNIYYIEDLIMKNENVNFNNHVVYFLCNSSLVHKVINKYKNINCYFINQKFFEKDYSKLEVQQLLKKKGICTPEIHIFDGKEKINYPIFCKENSHVGINFVAYSENTLVKFFSKFNVSDFYCEEIIKGGKESKLYFINGTVFDNSKSVRNNRINELFEQLSKILNLESFSADIISIEENDTVIDINPNSGFYGSNIARENFIKYVVECTENIINNKILKS